jgi:type IV pilus assembly protein PilM
MAELIADLDADMRDAGEGVTPFVPTWFVPLQPRGAGRPVFVFPAGHNETMAMAIEARVAGHVGREHDAFTVQNLFEYSRGLPQDQTIALLNVGASLSSLNIVANGVSQFTREIANGGNVITEEIQKALNVPFEQAEAYKCGGTQDPGGQYQQGVVPQQAVEVIEAVCDSIAAEIQRSLDFYMATSGEAEIARIFVTGGTASLASLGQSIEKRARVAVEVWPPTEKIGFDARDVDSVLLQSRAAQLSVALGLSLRKEREARA